MSENEKCHFSRTDPFTVFTKLTNRSNDKIGLLQTTMPLILRKQWDSTDWGMTFVIKL